MMWSAERPELIGRLQAREPQALGLLYDQLAPVVNAMLLRLLADRAEAEEVLVEAFWQVWNSAGSYDPSRGTLAAWVMTIARSRALDQLRARKRRAAGMALYEKEGQATPAPPVPEAVALQGERAQAVATALAALSEEQRLPIELAYYEGLSQAEIAGRLGQPLGTIKTRIRLGLSRLRSVLEPYLGEHT